MSRNVTHVVTFDVATQYQVTSKSVNVMKHADGQTPVLHTLCKYRIL